MSDYLLGILTALLPGAGAAIWYLVTRYNEKKPLSEALERAQKTADLKKTLEERNYTLEDLGNFQDVLMGNSAVAQRISTTFAAEAEKVGALFKSNAITQADLNQSADRAYQIANINLEHVISEYKKYLDPEEQHEFDKTQDDWQKFQKSNAAFAAFQYRGGSIQPLIYATALETTAISRLVELETALDEMRNTTVPYNER